MTERRQDARITGPIVRRISTMVRPGQWVVLMDVSASGALVAGRRPLRPGTRVEVHFRADEQRSALWALVVRCVVAAMDAERIVYHTALSFEIRAEWVGERETRDGAWLPTGFGRVEQDAGEELPHGPRVLEVVDMKEAE